MTSDGRKANAKEWRMFMSSRVSDTLSHASRFKEYKNKDDDDEARQKQEFKSIFKEVEKLGISQMSWKKRKDIEAQKRVALGAKAEKSHRMPISMGMNIKRKRETIEEQKRQEEIALGLRSEKKVKKTTEKPNESNRGLKASEGIFKDGVLYVKPLTVKKLEKDLHKDKSSNGRGKSHKKSKKGKHKGKKKRR